MAKSVASDADGLSQLKVFRLASGERVTYTAKHCVELSWPEGKFKKEYLDGQRHVVVLRHKCKRYGKYKVVWRYHPDRPKPIVRFPRLPPK